MKKLYSLIIVLVVAFCCLTPAYAWPYYSAHSFAAAADVFLMDNGDSIGVLVCDPFDAYINGNECVEVSYSGLVDLRDRLVFKSLDVRLMKGFNSDYYYLAYYESGVFRGCIGSASLFKNHVYRALGASTPSNKVNRIGTTQYYWIDSTSPEKCTYHYVEQSTFDGIMSTCRGAVQGGGAVVRESVLLSGTPCYILKMYKNGTWVGIVCDSNGPIYCSTVNGGTIVVDTGTGESGSGATFDATEVINAINSVFRAISSVDDSVSYVSTYLSRLNNNFINFANDFKLNYEMQGNDLSNIYSILLAMYQSFYDRFSDLDLTYYNDAEIQLYNGEYLDWSESDRGQISIEANDIGTLELLGFPDMDGYKATHSFGGDITIQRNDGTFFPDRWELPGGTVTMPTIESAYSSITVTAPVGSVISVAGNTHTFENNNPYSVNVSFGQYQIDVSYEDAGDPMTTSYTVDVDGYNDYAVNFGYTPGGFVVTVTSSLNGTSAKNRYITIDGVRYTPYTFYGSGNAGEFHLDVGSTISFTAGAQDPFRVCIDGESTRLITDYSYTVSSDCSIVYESYSSTTRWVITTSNAGNTGSIVGDFDTPTVTVTANTVTFVPVTIERLVRLSGGDWVAYDILGNSYSFNPVSELALNRSFVTYTYSPDEIANLTNFPTGYWQVSWSGQSQYITIKFEEYSKFFLWLNRFLINFRDTLFMKMQDISVTADGDVIIASTDYTDQLNMIIEKLDSTAVDVENIVDLNISSDNDSYNVFFVDGGEDGTQDDESIVDLSKDSLDIMGRLMNFLYQIMFKDSIANGGGMDDIIDFYTDTSQEVGDPWAA